MISFVLERILSNMKKTIIYLLTLICLVYIPTYGMKNDTLQYKILETYYGCNVYSDPIYYVYTETRDSASLIRIAKEINRNEKLAQASKEIVFRNQDKNYAYVYIASDMDKVKEEWEIRFYSFDTLENKQFAQAIQKVVKYAAYDRKDLKIKELYGSPAGNHFVTILTDMERNLYYQSFYLYPDQFDFFPVIPLYKTFKNKYWYELERQESLYAEPKIFRSNFKKNKFGDWLSLCSEKEVKNKFTGGLYNLHY